jgi:hypothetical protein
MMKLMMKILKAVWVGVKFAVGFTIPFALAAVIAWGAYSIGYGEGGRAVKRYTIEEVKDNPQQERDDEGATHGSQKTDLQGYKMTQSDLTMGWAVHRMDGSIYQSDYGSIGRILVTESRGEFNISMNNGITGYILRNGDQYDVYSKAGDRIGRLLPCRWDGNGNVWDIFTTTQGHVGHIDQQGNWILRLGCSLLLDLDTLHDYYVKNTKKFELPEEWPAGDGHPHAVKAE